VRQGAAAEGARRPLVAFDFDGTLTVRDSFNAFLVWRAGPFGAAWRALTLVPAALAYLVHRDRGVLKAALVRAFLRGVETETLNADAEAFAAGAFARLMRPDALERWEDWGRQGAERVIVTASPEPVVAPFAARLGADRLIGTRLAMDARGRLTGALDGPNCRGAEKVARLEAVYGPGLRLAAAYGDTSGDIDMLGIAEIPSYRGFVSRP
jgi:phosphatidylglycerophosphatase C